MEILFQFMVAIMFKALWHYNQLEIQTIFQPHLQNSFLFNLNPTGVLVCSFTHKSEINIVTFIRFADAIIY